MAVNFKDLLSKPTGKIEPPKLLPPGTYYGFLKSHSFNVSSKKKTPFVRYDVSINRHGADVDEDEIVGLELGKRPLPKDFFLTDDAEYILKEFIESLGVEMDPSEGLGVYIPQIIGADVMVEVDTQSNDEGRPVRNTITRIGPIVED